jgi:cytochrome P450
LHQEIDAVLGDRPPELADVPELRYAEMVLAEALRLYPPAWAIGRKAVGPFTLGEFEIPASSIRMDGRRDCSGGDRPEMAVPF